MKWLESRILWGVLLIAGGVIFLLENLNIIEFGGLVWALLFALASAVFFSVYFQERRTNWWAMIPAFTLLGIGAEIGVDQLAPRLSDVLGGSLVLGGIGAGFLFVYIASRENWWAIIPAGVLFTLAAVSALEETTDGETGGVFFLGLGLTFALVAVLPNPSGTMRWAWIPAVILLVMGVLFLAAAQNLMGYIWPAALILVGGFLILRALRPRGR
ncbi:MAG: hypothetical protein AB1894_05000 [Chloroflexota bacterium]